MVYLIYSQHPKYIKILKSIFSKERILTMDTEFPECIIVVRDPQKYIPNDIRPYIQIIETKDYKQFLKGFDSFTEMIKPSKVFKEGDVVRVIKGTYEGLSGVIKKVSDKNLELEISVFGRIVKDIFEFDEVEKIQKLF